ncbi:MAG: hypothetical protein JXA09_02525, partial [Anaerolineae bacterium]|nr:hypothetical protein [Anaerolineae bacterium]
IICARNLDLVGRWDVSVDLGLDAADVIDAESGLVVFSTELDSPPQAATFTAGDMLVTNGAIVPNVALTHGFAAGYDLGLDAVHLTGEEAKILAFLQDIAEIQREEWLGDPGLLSGLLTEYGVDIWFSTEGTFRPVGAQGFLDGDLLSARDGTIVAGNSLLLPLSVPAGIPSRGIDYGLDAVSSDRSAERQGIQFSTEILHTADPPFTDGDILRLGNGVVATNEDLLACFGPAADFLGLDALYVVSEAVLKTYLPVTLKDYGIPY